MNPIVIYLLLNAALYIFFGIWCSISPLFTSTAVGFLLIGAKGFAEFGAVYGGLETGIGLLLLISALNPAMRSFGILAALCTYGGLVIFRTIAIFRGGYGLENGWFFFIFEIVMALAALVLYLKAPLQ